MNTILSTSKDQFNYYILGSNQNLTDKTLPCTALILNRDNSQYRYYIFDNLISKGFSRIICVENKSSNLNTDVISEKYPQVEFVVSLEDLTQGEMINLGMTLTDTDYVFVLQEEMCIEKFRLTPNFYNILTSKEAFCVCPKLISQNFQTLPSMMEPCSNKSMFSTRISSFFNDFNKTLCSLDYVGLYNRNQFFQVGGFDSSIKSDYWQQMDLFIRSWLMDYKSYVYNSLSFSYSWFENNENQSLDKNYFIFFTKNLLPVYKNNEFKLKKSAFLQCFFNNSCKLFERIKIFNYTKKWIRENKSLFKKDIVQLINEWGN